jgi:arabinofuranosyltransferase
LSFYGEWLPNTYYAKVIDSWPESNFYCVISFVLEYALLLPFAIICWAVAKPIIDKSKKLSDNSISPQWRENLFILMRSNGILIVVIGALCLHISYYAYFVGGDHFEYRIFSHLLPVVFLAFTWSVNKLRFKPKSAIIIGLTFIIFSMPVPWTHWALTKDLNSRTDTQVMRVAIAENWPGFFRWYADLFDHLQFWLISHHVCMRHQEHKILWKTQIEQFSSREVGKQISNEGYPIFATRAVGVPAWVMPNVYIIDIFGLNNYVIARTPPPKGKQKLMAHSRVPLKKYIFSFQPNIEKLPESKIVIHKRKKPFTKEYLIANERYWKDYINNYNSSL